ncbi:MAG: hypothetical protein WCG27_06165, partial [Pseudomonadota bacterium]
MSKFLITLLFIFPTALWAGADFDSSDCFTLFNTRPSTCFIFTTHQSASGKMHTTRFADTNRGIFDLLGFGHEETRFYSMDSFDWWGWGDPQ